VTSSTQARPGLIRPGQIAGVRERDGRIEMLLQKLRDPSSRKLMSGLRGSEPDKNLDETDKQEATMSSLKKSSIMARFSKRNILGGGQLVESQ